MESPKKSRTTESLENSTPLPLLTCECSSNHISMVGVVEKNHTCLTGNHDTFILW